MKVLADFFPIILFFVAYKTAGIFTATAVAIAATVVQIGWHYFRHRRIEPLQWLSLGVIVLFGGATLLSQDETFIKWKPTGLYWAMGLAFLVSQFGFKRNLLKLMLGEQLQLPDAVWSRLSLAWVAFFAAMGVLNLWVAYHFSTDAWVNFKLFGGIGLMLLFTLAQGLYIGRHLPEEPAAPAPGGDARR